MSLFVEIEEQLKRDIDREALDNLEEFQYITLAERYIRDDVENYATLDNYVKLLEAISELTGLDFKDIQGAQAADEFVFSFELRGEFCSFSIPSATGDTLDPSFLRNLNSMLALHGIDEAIYEVFALGLQFADQCFHLVFLDAATYEELRQHPAGFVWADED
jgi:hypothetical protein